MATDITPLNPPQSFEAEQCVLGSIMKDSNAMAEVELVLEDERHFYNRKHQMIFRAAANLARDNKPTDITSMAEELLRLKELEKIGGRVYLVELHETIASTVNVLYHAEIVREKSIRRQFINTCNQVVQSCYMLEQPIEEIGSIATQDIAGLLLRQNDERMRAVPEVAVELIPEIDASAAGKTAGITCGFKALDELIGGLHPGDLYTLGGRPKVGKTSFSVCMAIEQAKQGFKPLYFSAETATKAFTRKVQCTQAEVDYMKWKMGRLDQEDTDRLAKALNDMSKWNFYVVGIPQIEIHLLTSQAALWKSKKNIDIIYVDYGQLITTQRYYRDRRLQIEYIVKQLKGLAQRLQVPVVVVSQISRDVVKGKSRQPTPADFKESGAWEENSDILSILWKPPMKKSKFDTTEPKLVELLLWQRNGPSGKKDFIFEAQFTKFIDPDIQQELDYSDLPPF